MLLLLLRISCFILSTNSSIDASLSTNDDTEIFKFVISKFKSSMYFWLSLFIVANCSTSCDNNFVSSFNISKYFCFSSFILMLSSFCLFIESSSCFNLSFLCSNLVMFSSIATIFWFSVAYSISTS